MSKKRTGRRRKKKGPPNGIRVSVYETKGIHDGMREEESEGAGLRQKQPVAFPIKRPFDFLRTTFRLDSARRATPDER